MPSHPASINTLGDIARDNGIRVKRRLAGLAEADNGSNRNGLCVQKDLQSDAFLLTFP